MVDNYDKFEQETSEFCNDLNCYLMETYGYKRQPAYLTPDNCIGANRKAFKIYLRCKPTQEVGWGVNTLVIAQIGFYKQRIGNGSSFLKFLVKMSAKYGFKNIGIEAAINEKIVNFAKKYGFVNYQRDSDWIVSIDVLRDCLERVGKRGPF